MSCPFFTRKINLLTKQRAPHFETYLFACWLIVGWSWTSLIIDLPSCSRMSLLILLCVCMDGKFLLENPGSTLIFMYYLFLRAVRLLKAVGHKVGLLKASLQKDSWSKFNPEYQVVNTSDVYIILHAIILVANSKTHWWCVALSTSHVLHGSYTVQHRPARCTRCRCGCKISSTLLQREACWSAIQVVLLTSYPANVWKNVRGRLNFQLPSNTRTNRESHVGKAARSWRAHRPSIWH